MRRLLALLLLLAPNAYADSAGCLQGQNVVPVPYASEKITISTSALPFTRTVYAPTGGSGPAVPAFVAVFSTETDTLRFLVDGTAPTSSTGMQVASGSFVTVCGSSIPTFKAIRSGSSDVNINVTYYRLPTN